MPSDGTYIGMTITGHLKLTGSGVWEVTGLIRQREASLFLFVFNISVSHARC